ncbi:FAD-dependent oxidoreductase [Paenibacillus allorhizosphaerae]|uniref:Thiamine thiazole synthase n=1 Tax=Paenibacillus allorhizosphaerae TaxID=2849866 RepID=A0ABM8VD00_9BACL|nr:FAD-dependent oxidoreductase [Paenibacillus allorhizosphaerae]CAG7625825.1 Thiamine thiazole synthase [Paenibacillus allorhizosphaerae]
MDKRIIMPAMPIPLYDEVDVLVAGGGPAGVAAALAAARCGASVLLIEQRGYLGGMATVSQVPAWCPFTDHKKPVIRGIGLEILNEMKSRMEPEFQQLWRDKLDWVPIDSEVLKKLLDDKMIEANVRMLYHTFISNVLHREGKVEAVIFHNKSGTFAVKAGIYVDCSSDADLAYHAGGQFAKGGEEGELQPGTMCFVMSNLNRPKYMEYCKEFGGSLKHAINEAKAKGTLNVVRDWAGISWVNDHTAGFNFGHIFGIDGSRAEDLTRGAIEGRALVHHIVEWLKRTIPGFEDGYLVLTGEQIGIRETRRIIGDVIVTADDFMDCRSFPDDIARNAYFIDIHMAKPTSGMTIAHLPAGESHGIPYRALLPVGIDNVIVAGRSISTDRATQGSTRVMPNCFAMGEAAGTAAALLTKQGLNSTRSMNIDELQKQLVRQGAWLGNEVHAKYGGKDAKR